jgi:hypothetical protein
VEGGGENNKNSNWLNKIKKSKNKIKFVDNKTFNFLNNLNKEKQFLKEKKLNKFMEEKKF